MKPFDLFADPLVRSRMKLSIDDQVLIIDEAHNIEDSCREACSYTILNDDLLLERNNLDHASKNRFISDHIIARKVSRKVCSEKNGVQCKRTFLKK